MIETTVHIEWVTGRGWANVRITPDLNDNGAASPRVIVSIDEGAGNMSPGDARCFARALVRAASRASAMAKAYATAK